MSTLFNMYEYINAWLTWKNLKSIADGNLKHLAMKYTNLCIRKWKVNEL